MDSTEHQKEVRALTTTTVELAADSLDRYRDMKAEQGVIDFVDMEHLMYRALDDPVVTNQIRDIAKLVFVDEFQDTSPIQLAIFAKLARVAERVVFVGMLSNPFLDFAERT